MKNSNFLMSRCSSIPRLWRFSPFKLQLIKSYLNLKRINLNEIIERAQLLSQLQSCSTASAETGKLVQRQWINLNLQLLIHSTLFFASNFYYQTFLNFRIGNTKIENIDLCGSETRVTRRQVAYYGTTKFCNSFNGSFVISF